MELEFVDYSLVPFKAPDQDQGKNNCSSSDQNNDSKAKESSNFPFQLFKMIMNAEEKGYDHFCCWKSHGRAFEILKRDEFVKTVLPIYFKQTTYGSFQRQLNLYGFFRIPRRCVDGNAYYHEMFLRGRSDLASRLPRIMAVGSETRKNRSPPNFYKLKPMNDKITTSSSKDQEKTAAQGPKNEIVCKMTKAKSLDSFPMKANLFSGSSEKALFPSPGSGASEGPFDDLFSSDCFSKRDVMANMLFTSKMESKTISCPSLHEVKRSTSLATELAQRRERLDNLLQKLMPSNSSSVLSQNEITSTTTITEENLDDPFGFDLQFRNESAETTTTDQANLVGDIGVSFLWSQLEPRPLPEFPSTTNLESCHHHYSLNKKTDNNPANHRTQFEFSDSAFPTTTMMNKQSLMYFLPKYQNTLG